MVRHSNQVFSILLVLASFLVPAVARAQSESPLIEPVVTKQPSLIVSVAASPVGLDEGHVIYAAPERPSRSRQADSGAGSKRCRVRNELVKSCRSEHQCIARQEVQTMDSTYLRKSVGVRVVALTQ